MSKRLDIDWSAVDWSKTIEQIAADLDVSTHTVGRNKRQLGLVTSRQGIKGGTRRAPWQPHEDAALMRRWSSDVPVHEIARAIGRGVDSTRDRLCVLLGVDRLPVRNQGVTSMASSLGQPSSELGIRAVGLGRKRR